MKRFKLLRQEFSRQRVETEIEIKTLKYLIPRLYIGAGICQLRKYWCPAQCSWKKVMEATTIYLKWEFLFI